MWSYFRDRCPQQTYLQNKFTNSSSQTHSQSYSRNRSVNIANTKVVDTTYQIAYFTLQVPNKVEYVYTDLCSKFNARSSFYYYYFFFFRSYKLFSGGFPTHFCRHRSPCQFSGFWAFRDVAQLMVVICYRLFGKNIVSLKMEPICFIETSITNYKPAPRKVSEERRPHLSFSPSQPQVQIIVA